MKHQPYLHLIIVILSLGGLISGIFAWIFLPDILIAELRSYAAEQIQSIAYNYLFESNSAFIRTGEAYAGETIGVI